MRAAMTLVALHEVQVHHLECEAADSLHQPHEGTLIGQRREGSSYPGYGDRAVVEFAHNAVPAWPTKMMS